MNRNGLKIGEFSRLCRVTVRALRHYEKIKLLVPEIIDYSTGYRYYSVGQMQKALNIVRLKGLGFSLEEIRTMYDSETQRPSINMLEEKSGCQENDRFRTCSPGGRENRINPQPGRNFRPGFCCVFPNVCYNCSIQEMRRALP